MMKKKNFLIVCFLSVLFCGCEKGGKQDCKEFSVASGICNLIAEKKYEAAYSRMDESFCVFKTLQDFTGEAEQFSQNVNQIKKINFSVINKNPSYFSFDCNLKTDGGKKTCNFIFSKKSPMPVNIQFSKSAVATGKKAKAKNQTAELKSEKKDISRALNQDSLKDLCKDYFKLGFGIYGYNKETNAINVPEYMEVAKKHFSSCTLTNLMKPLYILNEKKSRENIKNANAEPALDFNIIEDTLKWCKENNMQMRRHQNGFSAKIMMRRRILFHVKK